MLQFLGAALGALAGGQGQQASVGFNPGAETSTGALGRQGIEQMFPELQKLIGQGAGAQDVQTSLTQQRGLADLLGQYAQGGFLPSQQDWSTANQFAQNAMAPQQVALQQGYQQQQQRTAQLAAQLGRPVNDPILQARLAQEQMQGQERLGASQSAYASQFAQSLPQQRLMYAGQQADVSSQLASQAMANRQALIGLGSNLQQAGQQFQIQTGTKTSSQGGGLGGALSGGLAGFGAFANLANMFGKDSFAINTNGTGFDPFGPNQAASTPGPIARAQASMPIQTGFSGPTSKGPGMLSPNWGLNYQVPNANVGMPTVFDMLSPNIQQFNRGF
jgi:hypothetical protein